MSEPIERDTEEQAAVALGALRCLEDLVGHHHPDFGIAPGNLGYMLMLITDHVEKLLPIERMGKSHGRPSNDH